MLDTPSHCRNAVWTRCWAAGHCGAWNCHTSAPLHRRVPLPKTSSTVSTSRFGKTLGAKKEMWHFTTFPWTCLDKGQRMDVLFKFLRHRLVASTVCANFTTSWGGLRCRRKPWCFDLKIRSSVPLPLLPYYLTLFKHYMAQQRVDRAISYPPELVFLHTYWRASSKM